MSLKESHWNGVRFVECGRNDDLDNYCHYCHCNGEYGIANRQLPINSEIEDLKKQIQELKDKIYPPKKKVTYWANIYATDDRMYIQKSFIWESEEKALKSIGGKLSTSDYAYVKTISFEIEE